MEAVGVNTPEDLAVAERTLRLRAREAHVPKQPFLSDQWYDGTDQVNFG